MSELMNINQYFMLFVKQMHPHIETWGSILRLYGSKMAESYLKVNFKQFNIRIALFFN